MINIKMNDLLNCTEVLQKLAAKELKARLALQIARVLKEAERELANFNEVRMNLIKKYGEKDENGELITDDKGNCKIESNGLDTFSKELSDLVGMEVEINANKININDIDGLDFTPAEMVALEPFLDLGE